MESSISVASESNSEEINRSSSYMPKKIPGESIGQMEKFLSSWGVHCPKLPMEAPHHHSPSPKVLPDCTNLRNTRRSSYGF
ncbi:hypothetical protein ABKV19_016818 [Rosa sericea]